MPKKACRGSSSGFVPFNLLAINAYGPATDPGMGDHDDKQAEHVSLGPSDPYPQDRIPAGKHMAVFTCTMMRGCNGGDPLLIKWVDSSSSNKMLAEFLIGANKAHYQLEGVQYGGRKHGISPNPSFQGNIRANAVRITISARVLVIPSINEAGYDARINLDNFPSSSSIIQMDENTTVGGAVALLENPGQDVFFSEEINYPDHDEGHRTESNGNDISAQDIPVFLRWDHHSVDHRWPQPPQEVYDRFGFQGYEPLASSADGLDELCSR